MTPAQLELILSALAGAAIISLIVLAAGNRRRAQKRRYLPVFAMSALLGLTASFMHLQSLMVIGWIFGAVLGFALQRNRS